MIDNDPDIRWMAEALKEAERGYERGEVPAGAVVVHNGVVVGRGHNQTEELNDPTAHAEVIALGAAGSALQSWRMPDASLFVTLEPCMMCTGAILLARIGRVVYGADDPVAGAFGSKYDLIGDARLSGRLRIKGNVSAHESTALLQSFFSSVREKNMRRGAGAVERGGLENR